MKILMIGHGMVGHKFIESVLEQAGDDIELTILAEEPHLAYDRVHLTEYFSGPPGTKSRSTILSP